MALGALAGVFERGEFTRPMSSEEAKQEWRKECDQVAQFAEEHCIFVSGSEVTSSELYSKYKKWAEDAGVRRTLNHKNFTNRMLRLGAKTARGTGGTRTLAGVKLI